jgi:hypothetical protein
MSDAPPHLDPTRFQCNLDALRRGQPAAAEALTAARVRIPPAVAARTRDGAVNLRIGSADGVLRWFGGTSIPRVRATGLVDSFQSGQANVLLPGVGEGSEVDLLLARLAPHRAVFVWEPEPVNLVMALHLHDWAEAIRTERLVLVVSTPERLTAALLAVLDQLPGHFCPERILMWPWHTCSSLAGCRTAVERAYHETERRRRQRLSEVQATIAGLPQSESDSVPVAVLASIHTHEETLAWADRLCGAADTAGWQLAPAVIRYPGSVHPLARAIGLCNALPVTPRFALLLDVCRAEVADTIPADLPAVTWLTVHTPIDRGITSRLGPRDRIVASHSRVADGLIRAGVANERIAVQPLPVLLDPPDPPGWEARPVDVAVVASLPSTDPVAHGFELSTHVTLWRAALDMITADIGKFVDRQIEPILERAEQRVRMRIDDPAVREQFAQALAGPAATGLILHNLVQSLVAKGLKVHCWGSGWGETTGIQFTPMIPGLASRAGLYGRARCVLFASSIGVPSADLLVAAQAGSLVLWRAHPRDRLPGGLATLLQPGAQYLAFQDGGELTRQLPLLLSEPSRWQTLVTESRTHCLLEHNPAAALKALQTVATSFPNSRAS